MIESISARYPPLSRRANFSWNFIGKLFNAGSRAFLLVLIAKFGTSEMLGQYSLAFAITAPVFMMADLDLRSVLVTDAANQYDFGHYMGLRMVSILLSMIVVGFLAAAQRSTEAGLIVFIVGIAKSAEAVSDMLYGLVQRQERLNKLGMSLILKGVSSILLVGLMIFRIKSMVAGAIGLAAAYVLSMLLYDIPAARPYAPLRMRIDFKVYARLLRLSLPLGVVMLFISLNKNISSYFISAYLGSDALGYYASMIYIMTTGSMIVTALGQSGNARLARLFSDGDLKGYRKLLREMALLTVLMGMGLLLFAILLGEKVLTLLYQPEYASYQNIFVLIMGAAGISYTAEILQVGVTAARQFKVQPFAYGGVLLIGILLNWLLIPTMKLNGAAWCLLAISCLQLAANYTILNTALRRKGNRQMQSAEKTKETEMTAVTLREVHLSAPLDPALITDWKNILDLAESETAFSDPEWILSWWRRYGGDYDPLVMAAYDRNTLVGVLPMMLSKGGMHKTCSLIGSPQATYADLAILPEYIDSVLHAAFDRISGIKGPVVLNIHGLKRGSAGCEAIERFLKMTRRLSLISVAPLPVIRIKAQSFDQFYRSRFSSHAAKHIKNEKKLSMLGAVTFREMTADQMPEAFALHDARWKKKIDTSGFCDERSKAFFTDILNLKSERWKAMSLGLYLDGRLIAFEYGFFCGGHASLYKSAHDELFGIYAPGRIIKREYVRRCFYEPYNSVDFGIGYEEYKREWTDEEETVQSFSFAKGDRLSNAFFLPEYMKGRLRNALKKNRKIVLFRRNGLGRLKYSLSGKAPADFFRRAVSSARRQGVWTYIRERLHRRPESLLHWEPLQLAAKNRARPASYADAPALSLLMNCRPEDVVKMMFRQKECYLVRKEGDVVCFAWVSYERKSARIHDCRIDRRLCRERDVAALFSDILSAIKDKQITQITAELFSDDPITVNAARSIQFFRMPKALENAITL